MQKFYIKLYETVVINAYIYIYNKSRHSNNKIIVIASFIIILSLFVTMIIIFSIIIASIACTYVFANISHLCKNNLSL